MIDNMTGKTTDIPADNTANNLTDNQAKEQDYQRVATAINYITRHRQQQPSLTDIARAVHLSPHHFQRLFSRWAGTSPKRFLQVLTLEQAKQMLVDQSVLATSDQLGLSSPSRLYDHFVQLEAVTPGEVKTQGQNLLIRYSQHTSPFGQFFLAQTPRGICQLTFMDHPEDGDQALADLLQRWPKAGFTADKNAGEQVAHALFCRPVQRQQPLSLHVRGTNFQIQVWKALLRLPTNKLTSYGALAQHLNKPGASRAVGSAVGANPVSFLIPCHRVIQQSGGLGGYRWGLTRKQAILAWETAQDDSVP